MTHLFAAIVSYKFSFVSLNEIYETISEQKYFFSEPNFTSVYEMIAFFLPYLFDFKTFGRAWNWFQLSIYPKQKSHTQMQNAFETICALRATQTLRPGQICERKKSEMCVKHSCNYLQFSLFWWYLSSVHFVQNLNLVRVDAEFIL